jgi:hypothetical protein
VASKNDLVTEVCTKDAVAGAIERLSLDDGDGKKRKLRRNVTRERFHRAHLRPNNANPVRSAAGWIAQIAVRTRRQ